MGIKNLSYVLITPARNEGGTLGATIRAVAAQSILPLRWVILSDGSTDQTDEIALEASEKYPWVHYVRLPAHRDRHFAAKVEAFNAGWAAVRKLDYDIIGNLDADITFGEDYMEYLLGCFRGDPRLGVAGTPFMEDGRQYDYRFTSIEHVSGACQLFRRSCFEQIGGYVPIAGGGIDWTAVTTARMKGWRTRTFTDRVCHHHRKQGTGNVNVLSAWFRRGKKDYFLGGHPVWQVFRALYQMKHKPIFIGGLLLFAGFAWAGITGMRRPVSRELMEFHRKEQMQRLGQILNRFGAARL